MCLAYHTFTLSCFLYWRLTNKGTRTGLEEKTEGVFKKNFLSEVGWGGGEDKYTTSKIINIKEGPVN